MRLIIGRASNGLQEGTEGGKGEGEEGEHKEGMGEKV